MTNPLDEFLEDFGPKEKTAINWAGAQDMAVRGLSGVGKGLAQGAGAAAAAGAVGAVGLAASKIFGAATKARDFRQMLSYNPDLQEHHDRDPRMFNQMFSTLRTMNPQFSSDPIVAGSYMRRMSENPMTAGGIAVESVGHRDKLPSFGGRLTEIGMNAASKSKD